MTRTRWIIFAVICVVVLGGLIFFNKRNATTTSFNGDAGKVITEGPIADHVFGATNPKVVLIEYGDYQCPACGAMYSPLKELTTTYQDKLTFVFRNFPLTSLHPNALAAAVAAEAAGKQGKYYEMHDLLYDNQNNWSGADAGSRGQLFEQYASALGLNLDTYRKDLASADITTKIDRDRSTASSFSVNATPTFVLNGQTVPVDIGTDPQKLQSAVEDALRQAGFQL